MRTFGLTILLSLLCVGITLGQDELTWQWSPDQEYQKSTVKIWQGGDYIGSGVVIGSNKEKTLGYVLTAFHVVQNEEYAGIEWKDSQRSAGKVVLKDEDNDLAIVTCDPPDNVVVAKVAKELPKKGEACDHTGYGGDEIQLRTFYGQYLQTEEHTYTNTSIIKGDSGGGVWYDGKLIGIMSGGRYATTADLNFPIRSASLDAIKNLCNRVNDLPAQEVMVAQSSVPPNYFEFLGERVNVEVTPDGVTVERNGNGGFDVTVPEPVEVPEKKKEERKPQIAPPPVRPTSQILAIDTGAIAKSVVEYLLSNDMIPEQKVNDAEQVIRIANRLKGDSDFADLVAEKILDRIEQKVLQRIGKTILDESK